MQEGQRGTSPPHDDPAARLIARRLEGQRVGGAHLEDEGGEHGDEQGDRRADLQGAAPDAALERGRLIGCQITAEVAAHPAYLGQREAPAGQDTAAQGAADVVRSAHIAGREVLMRATRHGCASS